MSKAKYTQSQQEILEAAAPELFELGREVNKSFSFHCANCRNIERRTQCGSCSVLLFSQLIDQLESEVTE